MINRNKEPAIISLETEKGSFVAEDYLVTMERRRATLIEIWLKEPVPIKTLAAVFITTLGRVSPICDARTITHAQIGANCHYVKAVGLSRLMLDRPFHKRIMQADHAGVLKEIASSFSFEFVDQSGFQSEAKDWVFLSSVRNAFDQIWDAYDITKERWHLDVIGKRLILLPEIIGDAVELNQEFIIEESEDGVIYPIIPNLRPFVPVRHREKDWIIDSVTLDGKRQRAKLKLA